MLKVSFVEASAKSGRYPLRRHPPGSTQLGYANADHWSITLPFDSQAPGLAATLVTRKTFPRKQLLEAMLRTVEEALAEYPAR